MKKYSRKITELFPQRKNEVTFPQGNEAVLPKNQKGLRGIVFLKLFKFSLLAFLLISFLVLSLTVVYLYRQNEKLIIGRVEAQNKYKYWVQMSEKYPNYAKTFYMAAVYSMTLANKNEAIEYLDKAIEVDPDFVEAKKFRSEITQL